MHQKVTVKSARHQTVAAIFLLLTLGATPSCVPSVADPVPPATVESATTESAAVTSLDPQPLDEPRTLRVSLPTRGEVWTHVFLADITGEYAKENLFLEFSQMPGDEALPALAQGNFDVSLTGVSVQLFNLIDAGQEIRAVLPGASGNDVDGLWVRSDLAVGGPAGLAGARISTPLGLSFPGIAPIATYLAEGGLTLDDVTIEKIPVVDSAYALESGVVDAAWINSPLHLPLLESGVATRVTGYGTNESATAVFFGPQLLGEDGKRAGEAFLRATARAMEAHLVGAYKDNPETLELVAQALEISPEDVSKSPSLTFRREFDSGLYDGIQKLWIEMGDLLTYASVKLPEEYLIDYEVN